MSNLSILFWVRASSANKKGLAPLQIRLTMPNKDISNFSSGYTVDVKLWNPEKKQVNGRSDEAERINKYITRSETKLDNIYDELQREEKPISSEIIKNIFLGKAVLKQTLLGAIEQHNIEFKLKIDNEKDKKKRGASEETLKIFKNMMAKVERFIAFKYKRKDLFLSEVTFEVIEEFRTYLLQRGHKDGKGLSPDTATGNLKKLNKITTYHFKRGNIKQDPFLEMDLVWEDPTAQGLTEDQLAKFEKVELSLPRLQKVLDRFIVGCYSGMAHADISKVTRDDLITTFVDNGNWIKMKRTKTDEICKIPVLPPVQAIIDKYWNDEQCIRDNKLFPTVGLNSCNDYLKEIAVFAGVKGINVTTHVARHTFSIIMQDSGMDIDVLAQILGHADPKTTRKTYAKGSFAQVSNEMEKIKNIRFPKLKIVEENKNAG